MTKICQYCKCEYEAGYSRQKYCSHECNGMALRKATFERHAALAEELGIPYEELVRTRRKLGLALANRRNGGKHPKSYVQIRAANRRAPLVAGWRGAPVMGGW